MLIENLQISPKVISIGNLQISPSVISFDNLSVSPKEILIENLQVTCDCHHERRSPGADRGSCRHTHRRRHMMKGSTLACTGYS